MPATLPTSQLNALRALARKDAAKPKRTIVHDEDIVILAVSFLESGEPFMQDVDVRLWKNNSNPSTRVRKIRNVLDAAGLGDAVLVYHTSDTGVCLITPGEIADES